MSCAYIFNIKDKVNFEYGKHVLESEIKRGKLSYNIYQIPYNIFTYIYFI